MYSLICIDYKHNKFALAFDGFRVSKEHAAEYFAACANSLSLL